MKGVIRICIFGVLLTLAGCRSESLVEEEELYREQIDKIKFFENYEKDKNHRYDEEWLNYENTNNPAIPFSQSLKTLLVNRPEVAEIIKKHYGEIYWEATSRVIESKEGDKVVYYPIIGKGKDRNKYVLKSIVNKNHTYLRFEIQTKDKEELASQVLDNFAAYLSDNEVMESKCVDRNGIPTCDIDYVEIIRWKDRYVIKTPLPAFGYLPPANPPYYWDVGEGRYVGVECMNIGGCGESLPLPIPPMDNGDPCDRGEKVGKNPGLNSLMRELKGKVHSNVEEGFMFSYNGSNISQTRIVGKVGMAGIDIDIPIGVKIDGIFHIHYDGLLSIFSIDDIFALAQIYKDGNIKDINTFVMGVITASDTQYMLVIDNPNLFHSFTNSINPGMLNTYAHVYQNGYNIKPQNAIDVNERGFVNFLEAMKTGLKLLKGNDDMTKWKPMKRNSNGDVKPEECK